LAHSFRHRSINRNSTVASGSSFFNGWRSTPGTAPLTSQLALLISTTTTKVEVRSNAVTLRLRSLNWATGQPASIRMDDEGATTASELSRPGALLLTRDSGASWRELNSYSRSDDKFLCDVHQVLLLPSMPETVFMSTGVGLYKSLDAGETWERLTGADFRLAYPDHLAVSPDERSLFMAGAKNEPRRSWLSAAQS
jgi:photosystem II stability/assembly factor-like uncharacterized protein